MSRPEAGQPAPSFEMRADDDSIVSSEELRGTRYALYFYPKDDTPGCTKQACGLRDNFDRVRAAGLEVFGVSRDSVTSHAKFRDKYGLPFPLLADEGHRTADAYGVWVQKKFAGREYMGVERTSFIIGPDGMIEHVLPQVKPDEHVDLLLQAIAA